MLITDVYVNCQGHLILLRTVPTAHVAKCIRENSVASATGSQRSKVRHASRVGSRLPAQPQPAWSRQELACQRGRDHHLLSCPRSSWPLHLPTMLSPLPPVSVPSSLATATLERARPELPPWFLLHASRFGPIPGDGILFALDASSTLHCGQGQRDGGNGKRGWVFSLEKRFISF